MKQKILIKARINCQKCKMKAMQIVADVSPGVESVEIKGEQVVVTGKGVDCTTLACALRNKLGWAEIVSVEGQKAAAQSEKPAVVNPPDPPICYYLPYGPYPQVHVCECQNPSPCSIL